MFRLVALILCFLAMMSPAAAFEWRRIGNADLGFRVALPVDLFTERTVAATSVHLSDSTGDVVLDLYSAENTERLPPAALADELSLSERVDDVTYRRNGKNWFALSGYCAREGYESRDLVFYTKLMFSRDRSRFAAFEISYPADMKDELDRVVERIEETFRPLFEPVDYMAGVGARPG